MGEHRELRGIWDSDSDISPVCRDAVISRLTSVLESWQGTPWRGSSSIKGRGADCLGFVGKVVDELYRREFGVLDEPSPVGISHQDQRFVDFYKRAITLWPVTQCQKVTSGDIVLVRKGNGHSHLFICGPVVNTFWHCQIDVGVCYSGLTQVGRGYTCFKLLNKEAWA